MAPGKLVLWVVAAVVPVLPVALLAFSSVAPTEHENLHSLSGAWRSHDGALVGAEARELDDSKWPTLRLPGNFRVQGVTQNELWLRRTVELSAFDPSQRFFVSFGNIRNAMVDLYVNGTWVAREASYADYQTDILAVHGWELPRGLLQPGSNVLAAHFWWHADAPGPAVFDRRLALGPSEVVGVEFLRARTFRQLFLYGAIFVLMLVVPLLLILRATETRVVERRRLGLGAAMALAAAFYNGWLSGFGVALFTPTAVPEVMNLRIGILTVVIAPWVFWEFFEFYSLGRNGRLGRINRVLSLAFVVLIAVAGGPKLFVVVSMYLALPIGYLPLLVTRFFLANREPKVLALLSSVWCVALVGALDVLGNLSVLDLVPGSGVAFANVAIIITAVLLSEFVQYSRQNQVLTASLAERNEALGVALERAVESDRLKGEFLATMSHELRTPLNAIVNVPAGLRDDFAAEQVTQCTNCGFGSSANSAVDGPCPTCQQRTLTTRTQWRFEGDGAATLKHLSLIERSGQQLLAMVSDILEYTTLQAAAPKPSSLATSVSEVVLEVVEQFEALAREHEVSLRVPSMPAANAFIERERLRAIAEKLVKNAIQFSKAGGTVVVMVEHSESAQVVLRVKDDGIGIKPEHHALVFKAFRQVDGSTTRRTGGVGLGLALAKSLVEASGGTIGLTSAPGAGSTFWVELPGAPG